MNRTRWERWAPLSGLLYAALFVAGMVLLFFDEVDGKSDADIVAYFADGGNRGVFIAGFLLALAGATLFVPFATTLWSRLRSDEGRGRDLSALVIGAGVLASALLIAAVSLASATAFAVEDHGSKFSVDPNAFRLAAYGAYLLLIGAWLASAVVVIVTSAIAFGTSALPSWLGWIGIVAIVAGVVEAFLLPVFAMPVWAVVVSVVLLATEPTPVAAARSGR